MANRNFSQRQFSLERDVVNLFGDVTFGATGAVSAFKGLGLTSLTRTGVGAYTLTLNDAYVRLLGARVMFAKATSSGVAAVELVDSHASVQTDIKAKTVKFQCYDYAGAAVDPASGADAFIKLELRNTSVGPADF